MQQDVHSLTTQDFRSGLEIEVVVHRRVDWPQMSQSASLEGQEMFQDVVEDVVDPSRLHFLNASVQYWLLLLVLQEVIHQEVGSC